MFMIGYLKKPAYYGNFLISNISQIDTKKELEPFLTRTGTTFTFAFPNETQIASVIGIGVYSWVLYEMYKLM